MVCSGSAAQFGALRAEAAEEPLCTCMVRLSVAWLARSPPTITTTSTEPPVRYQPAEASTAEAAEAAEAPASLRDMAVCGSNVPRHAGMHTCLIRSTQAKIYWRAKFTAATFLTLPTEYLSEAKSAQGMVSAGSACALI